MLFYWVRVVLIAFYYVFYSSTIWKLTYLDVVYNHISSFYLLTIYVFLLVRLVTRSLPGFCLHFKSGNGWHLWSLKFVFTLKRLCSSRLQFVGASRTSQEIASGSIRAQDKVKGAKRKQQSGILIRFFFFFLNLFFHIYLLYLSLWWLITYSVVVFLHLSWYTFGCVV